MADKKISALTAATTPLAGTEVLPIVQSGATVKVSVDNLTAGKTVLANKIGVNTSSFATDSQVAIQTTSGKFDVKAYGGSSVKIESSAALGYNTTANSHIWEISEVTQMGLSTAGNLTLNLGNLIVGTAGKGIDFSANTHAAGMTSELLNWYETGTFTPVVADAATGGNVAASASASGIYTRIGNVVTVHFEAYDINTTGMTGANDLYIRGLPFANNASNSANGVVDMRNTAFTVYPTVFLTTSASAVRFFEHTSGGGVTPIPVSAVTASSAFFVTLTYTV